MNRGKLVWMPAFLAGASAATAAELSAVLLLYSGLGLLRALTVVLGVEMGAFALGLWTAWSPRERPGVDPVRRRWLFALVAFTAAAAYAGVTRILGGRVTGGLGQGLGLALLGGLPMFASGALLGSMGRLLGQGTRGGVTVGAAAASGAAAGFLLTGFFFIPALEPSSTLLACVIALSGGALVHGWVLDQREVTEELEWRWTPRGLVRVEDRARGAPPSRRRVLLENGRVRGSEYVEGEGEGGWQEAVLATVARGKPVVASVLVYGTGAGTLIRGLRAQARLERVVGIEPNPDVRRMAMAHFPPGRSGDADPWAGIEQLDGVLFHELPSRGERFDLVVVDGTALGAAEGVPPVPPPALKPALACLEPPGTLVIGGLEAPSAETRGGLEVWMAEAETLGMDRLGVAVGRELFLILAPAVDTRDWTGGAAAEVGRWTAVEEAEPKTGPAQARAPRSRPGSLEGDDEESPGRAGDSQPPVEDPLSPSDPAAAT